MSQRPAGLLGLLYRYHGVAARSGRFCSLRPLDLRNRRLGLVLRDAFQSGRFDTLHKVTVCRAAADRIVREIQGRPRQQVEEHWRAGPCDPIT
jgi:hypothetical protein